jgi:N4-gp56 family major capsid protein
MAVTTINTLPSPVQQAFCYVLLTVPVPNFIHKIPAMKSRMARNSGYIQRYRRYNPLGLAMVPLSTNGVTPPAQSLTAIDIDARMNLYGTYIYINERVTLQNNDPVLNEAAERLGVSLRQTEDQLIASMLASTASFANCTGGGNGDTPTEITRSDITNTCSTLAGNNANTITEGIPGRDMFGTAPIRNAYFALGHTALRSDLNNVQGFTQMNNYPDPFKALDAEYGSADQARFLLSSIGSFTANASNLGQNVYNIFFCGLEAYATIDQDGGSAEFLYLPPQFSGPLAQNISVGYKFWTVPRILNDLWIVNLRATVTAA